MARMLAGLDSYSYHHAAPIWDDAPPQPLSLHDYLQRAADLGLDGLETADMGHFPANPTAAVAELKSRADDMELYLELGTGGCDVDHLGEALHLSVQAGCDVLRTFLSIGRTWKNPADWKQDSARAVAALTRIIPVCEETGVALAIENHQDLLSAELVEILERVDHPRIGACLDTGNALGVMEHPETAARHLGPWTRTVHLKSYAILPHPQRDGFTLIGVPPSLGAVDLKPILQILADKAPVDVLHVNLESAVETVPVCAMRNHWREAHVDAARVLLDELDTDRQIDPEELEKTLSPWRGDLCDSLEASVALEDRLVRCSAREALDLIAPWRGA